jgi:AAA+ superfamily predicted ATPase
MAGQQLKDLIAAYRDRDDLLFRRAVQLIIQEEEAKKHVALARELKRLLASNGGPTLYEELPLPEPPRDRDSSLPLAQISAPLRTLSDLVVEPRALDALRSISAEVAHWPDLDAAGIPRRNRFLLYGPPGCGKTTAAAAIAAELGRPLVTARVEGLISSYLGETAANLRSLFDYASSGAYVVLLDEFDSLGKLRDDPADHGELRRIVNAVLQLIDGYRGPSILIAATNHPQVLDSALWRRFDDVIELPLPSATEIAFLLFRSFRGQVDAQRLESAASKLVGLPHAAAESFAHACLRAAVVDGRIHISPEDLSQGLSQTLARRWI